MHKITRARESLQEQWKFFKNHFKFVRTAANLQEQLQVGQNDKFSRTIVSLPEQRQFCKNNGKFVRTAANFVTDERWATCQNNKKSIEDQL